MRRTERECGDVERVESEEKVRAPADLPAEVAQQQLLLLRELLRRHPVSVISYVMSYEFPRVSSGCDCVAPLVHFGLLSSLFSRLQLLVSAECLLILLVGRGLLAAYY